MLGAHISMVSKRVRVAGGGHLILQDVLEQELDHWIPAAPDRAVEQHVVTACLGGDDLGRRHVQALIFSLQSRLAGPVYRLRPEQLLGPLQVVVVDRLEERCLVCKIIVLTDGRKEREEGRGGRREHALL